MLAVFLLLAGGAALAEGTRRIRAGSTALGEVGEGWRQVTSSLNAERVMVAAMCTGILPGMLEDTVAYASQRSF